MRATEVAPRGAQLIPNQLPNNRQAAVREPAALGPESQP